MTRKIFRYLSFGVLTASNGSEGKVMKSAKQIGTRNMDTDGKAHPVSTMGIASPKASKRSEMKDAEGIIKGDAKKAGEAVMKQSRQR